MVRHFVRHPVRGMFCPFYIASVFQRSDDKVSHNVLSGYGGVSVGGLFSVKYGLKLYVFLDES